eukprot:1479790-Ditylum_brightwellii.AAC.1
MSQELGEVKAKFNKITQLLTKTCSVQKSMVDTIQKTLLSKDKAQPALTESMEERVQKAIVTQLENLFKLL